MAAEIRALRADMNDRFDSVNDRFDSVDARLDHVDRELSQIKMTVGTVKIETSALIDAVADINKRSAEA